MKHPVDVRVPVGVVPDPLGPVDGDLLDAVAVEVENSLALHRRGRVVDVDVGPAHAAQGVEGPGDQFLARLHQHLDGDVVRDTILFDQPAQEVMVRAARRRETDLDLLETEPDQKCPQSSFFADTHGLEQCLVAVAKVDAGPAWGVFDEPVWPLAVVQGNARCGSVLAVIEGHAAAPDGIATPLSGWHCNAAVDGRPWVEAWPNRPL